ncbi:MAG: hypothetical protein CMP59_09960 [Flavobacteriales bacterium]|nr:hypothetical protein [Flavobacteriales bacterium]|tara:strand:- start:969 stop:1238 length:270 start_codon:yes stop_codon:yes gene_type:complete
MNVIVTGASGGFGALTVKTLLSNGHKVAASMRNINSKNKEVAEELSSLGAKVIEMDVTNDQSVISAIDELLLKSSEVLMLLSIMPELVS